MACPDENALIACLKDPPAESVSVEVRQHIEQCGPCQQKLADLQSRALLDAGSLVDHFAITSLIGRGGMGEVYLARDIKLGRKVALKVVRRESLGSQEAIDRFLAEARTTAQFNHPHIVTIHGVGEHHGSPYMALEYVDGQTLRQRLDTDPPELGEALRIGLSIAEALVEAHKHQVLHRDLTPQNVLLAKDGRLRVLDFGLAKRQELIGVSEPTAGANPLRLSAGMSGTSSYMAPEQWQQKECRPATDVWALGLILYEMASGRPPYVVSSTGSVETLSIQVTSPIPVPAVRIVEPGYDDLADLIDRCLHKDPAERPPASEVAVTLKRILGGARSFTSAGRRMATVLLSYAGVSFSLLQCVDLAVNRYVLSSRLVDLCLYLILLLIPTGLLLGVLPASGKRRRWRRWQRWGIAGNLGLTALILFLSFRGKDLGAATQKVQVAGEDGKLVAREIAKSEFIKRISLFFFDNDSGDPSLNWLQLAIPELIEIDLQQDSFFRIIGASSTSAEELSKSGRTEYARTPLALKLELARSWHRDYLLAGSFKKDKDDYVIRYTVYKTQRGQRLVDSTVRGPDLLPLIDDLTIALKHDLGVPTHHIETTTDLPVAELSTSALAALRDYTLGSAAWELRNDSSVAKPLLLQAVAKDPSFALAQLTLAYVYQSAKESAMVKTTLRAAKQNEYRISERERIELNLLYLSYEQAFEKQEELLKQLTTLYPEDLDGWRELAHFYRKQDRGEEAVATLEKLREIAPGPESSLELIWAYRNVGNFEKTMAALQEYATSRPKEVGSTIMTADTYLWHYDFEPARVLYQKSQTLDPAAVFGQLGECRIDLLLGNFAAALAHCQQAMARISTPKSRVRVYQALRDYYAYRGMLRAAIDNEKLRHAAQNERAVGDYIADDLDIVLLYLRSGQNQAAQAVLIAAESTCKVDDGPLIVEIRLRRIFYDIYTKDVRSAEVLIKETEPLLRGYGVLSLRPKLRRMQGNIHEQAGDYQQALKIYTELPRYYYAWTAADIFADIGRCQRQLGQQKDAETSLQQGLKLIPSHPELHYELARLYEQSGRIPEARIQVQTALKAWTDADPEFAPAQKARELATRLQ